MEPLEEGVDPFVGRHAELNQLRGILAEARGGQPRTVLIEGPSGIGKTALIDRFLHEVEGVNVLRASGEHWEALVAYGIVDQLLRVAGVSGTTVLAGRERSLPAEEPIGVGARLLEVMADLEQKAPLTIVIDDAHWADTDSLRALLFALRRLVAERIVVLLAIRAEESGRLLEGLRRLATGQTGRTLRLSPLAAAQFQQLASALGVHDFSSRAARRLQAHTHGNPLYARALLAELPADRWRTWEPVLPAPRAFATQVVRRLEACAPPARRLVEAASVLGQEHSAFDGLDPGRGGEPADALEEAGIAGLLNARDEPGIRDVMFPHPLVQAAVYDQLGPARRVELHLAAAGLVQDEGSALRHRVAAATPPDRKWLARSLTPSPRGRRPWARGRERPRRLSRRAG